MYRKVKDLRRSEVVLSRPCRPTSIPSHPAREPGRPARKSSRPTRRWFSEVVIVSKVTRN